MANRSLGGGAFGMQAGVVNGSGLNNVGLLVRYGQRHLCKPRIAVLLRVDEKRLRRSRRVCRRGRAMRLPDPAGAGHLQDSAGRVLV